MILSTAVTRVVTSKTGQILCVVALTLTFLLVLSGIGVEGSALGLAFGSVPTTLLVTLGGTAALISLDMFGLSRLGTLPDAALLEVQRALHPAFRNEHQPGLMVVLFLVAAAWEELLYRGAITLVSRQILTSEISVVAAVLVGSTAFAVAHLRSRIQDTVYPFIFGLVFGALYLASGSLLAPIIAHAAGNSFVYFYARRILKRRVDERAFFF
jgi:membrane protease YdiL (CAAX protease family)